MSLSLAGRVVRFDFAAPDGGGGVDDVMVMATDFAAVAPATDLLVTLLLRGFRSARC